MKKIQVVWVWEEPEIGFCVTEYRCINEEDKAEILHLLDRIHNTADGGALASPYWTELDTGIDEDGVRSLGYLDSILEDIFAQSRYGEGYHKSCYALDAWAHRMDIKLDRG